MNLEGVARKAWRTWGCAAALLALAGRAEAEAPTVTAEADWNSRYVWRGIALSEGAVVQPQAAVDWRALTLTGWANYVTGHEANGGQVNEVEVTAAVERRLGRLTIVPTALYYFYPNRTDFRDSGELALRTSHPAGPLEVYLNLSVDVVRHAGSRFVDAGVAYERPLGERWMFGSGVTAGWGSGIFNENYLGSKKNAFNMVGADVSLIGNFGGLRLRPHLEWSRLMDDELRALQDEDAILKGGFAVGLEF